MQVFNGVEVERIDEKDETVALRTATGRVFACRYCVVATNGFARKLLPDLMCIPARNQVLVTEPVTGNTIDGCFHYNEGYVYFRNIGSRILIGGARNTAKEEETTSEFGMTDTIRNSLLRFLRDVIVSVEVKVAHEWSGIMGVGETKDPIVKMVSDRQAVAVKLGGMGVALGSLVGDEAASLIGKRL